MDDERTTRDVAARTLIDKVKAFAASLDDHERSLFAALLAPGIDAAWTADLEEAEVAGFELEWSPERLPGHLTEAIRTAHLRISTTDEG
ncbi:MAG TPA: hypothetical protein VK866_14345 [Acidimicrobiales bacterium]|nr:hypothetical protein [Acidimicrobiales bacterium]